MVVRPAVAPKVREKPVGCVGRPIPIPYPESELGPPPGMPTGATSAFGDDSGEAVIFQR